MIIIYDQKLLCSGRRLPKMLLRAVYDVVAHHYRDSSHTDVDYYCRYELSLY